MNIISTSSNVKSVSELERPYAQLCILAISPTWAGRDWLHASPQGSHAGAHLVVLASDKGLVCRCEVQALQCMLRKVAPQPGVAVGVHKGVRVLHTGALQQLLCAQAEQAVKALVNRVKGDLGQGWDTRLRKAFVEIIRHSPVSTTHVQLSTNPRATMAGRLHVTFAAERTDLTKKGSFKLQEELSLVMRKDDPPHRGPTPTPRPVSPECPSGCVSRTPPAAPGLAGQAAA